MIDGSMVLTPQVARAFGWRERGEEQRLKNMERGMLFLMLDTTLVP